MLFDGVFVMDRYLLFIVELDCAVGGMGDFAGDFSCVDSAIDVAVEKIEKNSYGHRSSNDKWIAHMGCDAYIFDHVDGVKVWDNDPLIRKYKKKKTNIYMPSILWFDGVKFHSESLPAKARKKDAVGGALAFAHELRSTCSIGDNYIQCSVVNPETGEKYWSGELWGFVEVATRKEKEETQPAARNYKPTTSTHRQLMTS